MKRSPSEEPRIALLAEHPGWIAVDKPDGLATIRERDTSVPCLHTSLEESRGERLWIVHRLDKEVSGCVLFARSAEVHKELSFAFEERRVRKTYHAWVHGHVRNEHGTIEEPIKEFGSGRMGVSKNGKPSMTEFTVKERSNESTLLELHPITGRRHQLRVHLYALGHPILGDVRYGDAAVQAKYARVFLHSSRIEFRLENACDIASPLPALFLVPPRPSVETRS